MTMPHLMNCNHQDSGWCLNCVKSLHDELTSAQKSEQDCRQIITTYCEEIDGLNKLISQFRTEIQGVLDYCDNPTIATGEKDADANLCASLAITIAQKDRSIAQQAGVPYDLCFRLYCLMNEMGFSHACINGKMATDEQIAKYRELIHQIDSYAPKGNQ